MASAIDDAALRETFDAAYDAAVADGLITRGADCTEAFDRLHSACHPEPAAAAEKAIPITNAAVSNTPLIPQVDLFSDGSIPPDQMGEWEQGPAPLGADWDDGDELDDDIDAGAEGENLFPEPPLALGAWFTNPRQQLL